MVERWVCVFESRTGGRAQALFDTGEQARQFAERHARSMASNAVDLKWQDLRNALLLATPIGDYRVALVGAD